MCLRNLSKGVGRLVKKIEVRRGGGLTCGTKGKGLTAKGGKEHRADFEYGKEIDERKLMAKTSVC